jgi:hypothetical protein
MSDSKEQELELLKCFDVINRRAKPDPAFYREGWDAHCAGKAFHEHPYPQQSYAALCWRIGWNDHALQTGSSCVATAQTSGSSG